MTNALGLAAVTAILRDLLDNGLVDRSVGAALGGDVKVSALPPDRVKTGNDETAQLNVYLYHVTPNAAFANSSLPSHDAQGDRLADPPLALDLHYLVSAYANKDLDAEVLLGFAALVLHDTPVLTRDVVRRGLRPTSGVNAALLPGARLDASALADQAELVRLTMERLDSEETSKLWTAFQAKHRPSVALRASVVLLESGRAGRSALPVLSRGERDETGREAGVHAQASLLAPFPTLLAATPPHRQPALRTGDALTLSGHHLGADAQSARFLHVKSGEVLVRPREGQGNDAEFRVSIPVDPLGGPAATADADPDSWRAGVYSVAAVLRTGAQPPRVSNEVGVLLAPRAFVASSAGAPGETVFTVQCRPKAWRGQRVSLLVGDQELTPEPFAGEKTSTLVFRARGVAKGAHWFRLRVDGVESLLVDASADPPAFDPTQRVVVA